MRGTPGNTRWDAVLEGIIPAHAGNTFTAGMAAIVLRDHPRTCGEHHPVCPYSPLVQGSSPHMRGTHPLPVTRCCPLRIIPAHAGNTLSAYEPAKYTRDHPRTCGEHCQGRLVASADVGSSPHMRGTRANPEGHGLGTGIIPAHAGNTMTFLEVCHGGRDHPRTCGEHDIAFADMMPDLGSSPHMRGTPAKCSAVRTGVGIIPAHAGEH